MKGLGIGNLTAKLNVYGGSSRNVQVATIIGYPNFNSPISLIDKLTPWLLGGFAILITILVLVLIILVLVIILIANRRKVQMINTMKKKWSRLQEQELLNELTLPTMGALKTVHESCEQLGLTGAIINIKDLDMKEKIGSGGFGVVYRGTLRKITPVAIKKILLPEKNIEKNLKILLNEIRLWK